MIEKTKLLEEFKKRIETMEGEAGAMPVGWKRGLSDATEVLEIVLNE